MRRRLAVAAAAFACVTACTAAAATPPVIRTVNPPAAAALTPDGMWVVVDGPQRTLRLFSTATGKPVGEPVVVDTRRGFGTGRIGRPIVQCCEVPYPLAVAGGAAWTLDLQGRRVIRATAAAGVVRTTAIPMEGLGRDLTAGTSTVHVLEVRVPGAGNRIDDIDPATGTLTPGPAFTGFGTPGPGMLAAGNPGVYRVTFEGARMALVTTDGREEGGIPARILSRVRGVTWAKSLDGCEIRRMAPDGSVRTVPPRWADRSRGGCRTRAIAGDGAGDVWVIGGNLRPGARGVVYRVSGATGRLVGRPFLVGRDPWVLVPARGGVWVGDDRSRTLRFFPAVREDGSCAPGAAP
ncbi:MAG: hypothetical protein U0237_01500 [Thermoleophilia bacterium]